MTGPDDIAEAPDPIPRWRRTQSLGVWWVLPVGLVTALVFWAQGHLRSGGFAMGATLVLAAVLRLLLPRRAAGGLLVRSRTWDVITLLALAAAVTLLSATLVIR